MQNGKAIEGEVVEDKAEFLSSEIALVAADKAAIDVQIATAKKYPRSLAKAKKEAMELACLDEETATAMGYALPRSGKTITGPSVRLAEIVAYTYGNLRVEARIVSTDADYVTAEGTAADLERNNAVRVQVRRRIRGKDGKRYNDDMIVVTGNAAASIAFRNALFKLIPAAFFKPVYDRSREVARGDEKTFGARRDNALKYFAAAGVTKEQLLAKLGRNGIEEVTTDDLVLLGGFKTSIEEGAATAESIFGDAKESANTSDLSAKVKARKEAATNEK